MSLPNKYQTRKQIPNAVNFCPAELGTSSGLLPTDWLYPTDLEAPSIDQLPLYAPVNLAEKQFDAFGNKATAPFGGAAPMPLPTTVCVADLNLDGTPVTPVTHMTSEASRTTSGSDDSLLLGSGATDNSESLTTPDDSDIAAKPAYKPGWATASGVHEPEGGSSTTPQSKKRAKNNAAQPVKPQRTSPRNLSLSSAAQVLSAVKEEDDDDEEFSPSENTGPGTSKSKRSHNLTEKKYRTRLNGYFETLLSAIPKQSGSVETPGATGDAPEKKISKGEVLVLAMDYIKDLEREQTELEEQRKTLSSDMEHLKDASTGIEANRRAYPLA